MEAGRAEWFVAACARLHTALQANGSEREAWLAVEAWLAEYELWRLGERGAWGRQPEPSLAEPPREADVVLEFVDGPQDGRLLPLPARARTGTIVHCRDGSVYVIDVDERRARHVPPAFLGARSG